MFQLTVNTDVTATQSVPTKVLTQNLAATSFTPVTGGGGTSPLAYSISPALPTGLAISSTTGAITGTPTATISATSFTVTVTDANSATATNSFSLKVNGATTATQSVATTALTAGTASTAFTPVTGSGGTGTLSYALFNATGTAAATLPTGLAFSTTTGAISGTPTTLLAATTFTVKVTDQTTPTLQVASATFQLAVNPATLVTVQAAPSTTLTESIAATAFTPVTGSGGFGTLSYALSGGTLPTGLTFSTTTGAISGTSAALLAQTTFTVTVTDQTTPTAQTSSKTFQLTVNVGTPASIAVSAGNAQSTTISTVFATSLAVIVKDVSGNPVPGASVAFVAPSSGASGIFAGSSTVPTNSSGIATAPAFTANAIAGSYAVTATVNGVAPASFSLTNVAGAPSQEAISGGNTQSAPVSTPYGQKLSVTVTDSGGNPLAGVSVTFTAPTGGASGTCTIVASGPGTATYAAAVSVTQSFQVNQRPDPSKNPEVIGIITVETQASQQFAQIQIGNVNSRLEQMHGEGTVADSFGISLVDGIGNDDAQKSGYADDADPASRKAQTARSATDRALRKQDKVKTDEDRAKAAALDRAFSFWTAGAINVGRIHANNTVSTTDLTTGGLSAGVDYRFNQFISLGLGLGYGAMSSDVGTNGTSVTDRNYDAILYASLRPTTYAFVDVVAGAGLLDFSSRRFITGGNGTATGKRSGREFFGSLTAGIELKTKEYLISPYARLDGKTGTLNAFDENAPAPWAQHYDKETFSTASVNLGMKAALHTRYQDLPVSPFLRAEFQHDLTNATSAGVTYVDLVGLQDYTVALQGSDQNRIMLGIGTEIITPNDFKLTLEYLNTFSTSSSADASTFKVKVTKAR